MLRVTCHTGDDARREPFDSRPPHVLKHARTHSPEYHLISLQFHFPNACLSHRATCIVLTGRSPTLFYSQDLISLFPELSRATPLLRYTGTAKIRLVAISIDPSSTVEQGGHTYSIMNVRLSSSQVYFPTPFRNSSHAHPGLAVSVIEYC